MTRYSSEITSAVLLRDNVTLSLEPVILKMVPTCSQHENQWCLKMLHDNKTPGGASVGKLVQRENLSHQNYTKVYYQDEFLISTAFWNKLFFCFQKKKKPTKCGLNKCKYDFVPLSRSEESDLYRSFSAKVS